MSLTKYQDSGVKNTATGTLIKGLGWGFKNPAFFCTVAGRTTSRGKYNSARRIFFQVSESNRGIKQNPSGRDIDRKEKENKMENKVEGLYFFNF